MVGAVGLALGGLFLGVVGNGSSSRFEVKVCGFVAKERKGVVRA